MAQAKPVAPQKEASRIGDATYSRRVAQRQVIAVLGCLALAFLLSLLLPAVYQVLWGRQDWLVAKVMAEPRVLVLFVVIPVAAALLLLGGINYWNSMRAARSLDRPYEVIEKLSSGRFPAPIPMTGREEFPTYVSGLNDALERLNDTFSELREKRFQVEQIISAMEDSEPLPQSLDDLRRAISALGVAMDRTRLELPATATNHSNQTPVPPVVGAP